jgi:membrane-bound lytic murein transglycosylase D
LILAAIIVARNPVQYGFDATPENPVGYDKVTLPRAIDLRRVAEWTGHSIDEIQALNPELRRWTTPLKDPAYELKLPAGTADEFMARLKAASPDDLVSLKWYTVRRGESLATIARKLRVSRLDLAEANHLSTRSRVNAGQSLVIPRAPTTLLASSAKADAPSSVASRPISGSARVADAAPQAAPAVARASSTRADDTRTLTYRVKQGDTLFGIARLFDTTVDKIKSWNRLRSNRIAPGDRLTIRETR